MTQAQKDAARLNWTKVGLKAIKSEAEYLAKLGLNWTKVGLKVEKTPERCTVQVGFELD